MRYEDLISRKLARFSPVGVDSSTVMGGQAALGRALGLKQQAIFNWLHTLKHVPAECVLAVERAAGVSRHDLRPDIYRRDG